MIGVLNVEEEEKVCLNIKSPDKNKDSLFSPLKSHKSPGHLDRASSINSEKNVDNQLKNLKIEDFKNSETSSNASHAQSQKNKNKDTKNEEKEESVESGVSSEAPQPQNESKSQLNLGFKRSKTRMESIGGAFGFGQKRESKPFREVAKKEAIPAKKQEKEKIEKDEELADVSPSKKAANAFKNRSRIFGGDKPDLKILQSKKDVKET